MATKRKLGFSADRRSAVLRGLTTAFLINGKITTTEQRAKEVQKVVEKLISKAAAESGNFTSKSVQVSKAAVDGKGKKTLVSATSKNGNKFKKVERQIKSEMQTVDAPSRLAARKRMMRYIYRFKDENGSRINVTSKLFDEIGPKYKDRKGGCTRIYKIGPRKGDAAEMAILELV
jgi:large subunit ribosomal protein L17